MEIRFNRETKYTANFPLAWEYKALKEVEKAFRLGWEGEYFEFCEDSRKINKDILNEFERTNITLDLPVFLPNDDNEKLLSLVKTIFDIIIYQDDDFRVTELTDRNFDGGYAVFFGRKEADT